MSQPPQTSRLKIEMVVPLLIGAGMEVMVARMARKLARRGHDVGVTCLVEEGSLAPELRDCGVRVSHPDALGLFNTTWLTNLTAHFRSISPDVLHLHSGTWFKAATAGRRAQLPYVMFTAHGFIEAEPLHEGMLHRIAAHYTDRVVAVSEHLASTLTKRGLGDGAPAVVINGIDIEQFHPRGEGSTAGAIRSRFGLSANTLLVGTVARLEPIKNQAMLIDAIALAHAAGFDCAAVLVGEGALEGQLRQQAKDLGVADRVHFWGLERHVARLYPELDIFVLSSDAEGTSISLLEAMASGVCPVATSVGGNPAVVGNGEGQSQSGVLVGRRRPDELAAAIGQLAADPIRRRRIGLAARERIVAHFSDETMVDAYERLYREPPARAARRSAAASD